MMMRPLIASTLAAVVLVSACSPSSDSALLPGDPKAGARIIVREACGSCHVIPGIQLADGLAGPPLGGVADRVIIAGRLRNTPANMVAWLRDPQAISPGTVMPDTGLSERQARDVAAYLYTLR